MLVLNGFTLVLLLNTVASDSDLFRGIDRFFRKFGSGRGSGRLLTLAALAVLVPLIWLSLGRLSYFQRTIRAYEELDPEKQKTAGNRGLYYVIASFGLFFVVLIFSLF